MSFDINNLEFQQISPNKVQVYDKTNLQKVAVLEKVANAAATNVNMNVNGEIFAVDRSKFQAAMQFLQPNINIDLCIEYVSKARNKANIPKAHFPAGPPSPPSQLLTPKPSNPNNVMEGILNRPQVYVPVSGSGAAAATAASSSSQADKKTKAAGTPVFTPPLPPITPQMFAGATADKLWSFCWAGYPMDGVLLLNAIKELDKKYKSRPNIEPPNPNYEIQLHKLYDKAAEILLKQGKFQASFEALSLAAQVIKFQPSHEMYDLDAEISRRTKHQADGNLGAHFSHLNTDGVKGQNIRAISRTLEKDKTPTNILQFKINPVLREKLNLFIEAFRKNPEAYKDALPPQLKAAGIEINEIPHNFVGKGTSGNYTAEDGFTPSGAKAIEINFQGIGKIIVGRDKADDDEEEIYATLANDVRSHQAAGQKPGQAIEALQQMFSVVGLGPVLAPSRPEDIERVKIGRLFHTFFPRESDQLQATPQFYEYPPDKLLEKIIQMKPEMGEIYKKYYPQMKEEEIYPGRSVWTVNISNDMRAKGAIGLMIGTGNGPAMSGQEAQAARKNIAMAARMLDVGLISGQDRLEGGYFGKGVSFVEDLEAGGGDQVFTRLVTNTTVTEKIKQHPYYGTVQFICDLDVVNRGGYGYPRDLYGRKHITAEQMDSVYRYVPEPTVKEKLKSQTGISLIELVEAVSKRKVTDNEIMIKNRIGPELIRGLVVATDQHKEFLKADLIALGFRIEKNPDGVEIAVSRDGKIRAGLYVADPANATFNANMWKKV